MLVLRMISCLHRRRGDVVRGLTLLPCVCFSCFIALLSLLQEESGQQAHLFFHPDRLGRGKHESEWVCVAMSWSKFYACALCPVFPISNLMHARVCRPTPVPKGNLVEHTRIQYAINVALKRAARKPKLPVRSYVGLVQICSFHVLPTNGLSGARSTYIEF